MGCTAGRVLLVAVGTLLAATSAFALDAELRRRALSKERAVRWAACQPLAKDGSVEAARLLAGILKSDPEIDLRDHALWACWYLGSDEAVDVLAGSVTPSATPVTRCRITAAIARSRRPRALEALLRVAKSDPTTAVRCEAVEGMTWFKSDPRALEACRAAAKSSDAALRASAVAAAGRIDGGAAVVLPAWSDVDAGVRCSALAAMPDDDAVARLRDAAGAREWSVRAQTVETALRIRRVECVDVLVELVADDTLRVAGAALRALRFLTGKDFAADADVWRTWWAANRDQWKAPDGHPNDRPERPPDPKSTRARFQGIEVDGERVAFVIDQSTSMLKAGSTGRPRNVAVLEELRRTLAAMPDGVRVNLVLFGREVRTCFPTARALSDKVRQAIFDFAVATPLEADTNLGGGILQALEDADVDTAFVLTDGSPSCGDFASSERVRTGVLRTNRRRKVAIHTIGFGVTEDFDRTFLRNLATENGGTCVFR